MILFAISVLLILLFSLYLLVKGFVILSMISNPKLPLFLLFLLEFSFLPISSLLNILLLVFLLASELRFDEEKTWKKIIISKYVNKPRSILEKYILLYKENFFIKSLIFLSSGFIVILPLNDKININIIKFWFISFSLYIDLFCKSLYNLISAKLKELSGESNSIIDIFCFFIFNNELILSMSSYLFII